MKILALTSRWPYPVVGGDRLRFHAICREMRKRHRVTLLALCETRAEMAMEAPDDGVFAARHRVFLPRWRSWLNCAAALPGRSPLQVAYYRSAEFRARVAALLPQHDAALAHLIRVAEYLADARAGRPAVLEMTDAISMNYARVAAVGGGLFRGGIRGLIYRVELPRLLKYERAVAARFAVTVLCSPVDRDFLFPPPAPANILVCGNGVDFERVEFSPPGESPAPESSPSPQSSPSPPPPAGIAVFIGNMRTLQNRDAAWWFCRRILPLLRRRNPAWALEIIGPVAAREKARFNRLPGVTATGTVDDVAATVRALRGGGDGGGDGDIEPRHPRSPHPRHPRASLSGGGGGAGDGAGAGGGGGAGGAPGCGLVGICPMRAGAGVQNKILDYMAFGLPCVTTAIGAEGLRARAGEELLIADSAEEFAAAVARLAADSALARRLSINARRHIETAHAWRANLAPLMARLDAWA